MSKLSQFWDSDSGCFTMIVIMDCPCTSIARGNFLHLSTDIGERYLGENFKTV